MFGASPPRCACRGLRLRLVLTLARSASCCTSHPYTLACVVDSDETYIYIYIYLTPDPAPLTPRALDTAHQALVVHMVYYYLVAHHADLAHVRFMIWCASIVSCHDTVDSEWLILINDS